MIFCNTEITASYNLKLPGEVDPNTEVESEVLSKKENDSNIDVETKVASKNVENEMQNILLFLETSESQSG